MDWAARARLSADWDRTASLLALLANVHRDPRRRGRAFTAADFHPLLKRRPAVVADMAELKEAFRKIKK